MSDFFNAYDPYSNKHQPLDFFSFHSPLDVVAPDPDLFESDIDSNLAAFPDHQLQLLTVESNHAYNCWKAEQHHQLGPPSTITVSSESYESLSSHSDSFYEQLSYYSPSNIAPSQLLDLDMEFSRVRVGSEYSTAQSNISLLDDTNDPTSFGTLPPTPPRSPPVPVDSDSPKVFEKSYIPHTSYSDYCPPRQTATSSSDYYSHLGYTPSLGHPSVSPLHISAQPPTVTSVTLQAIEECKGDPRKKYRCTACPRAFARAYNLKTHMATHDPNRLKPHVCPQRSCGRSFSRKHDLGRHLISIHRDESVSAALLPVTCKKSVGVENGSRSWCDSCGKGWVGRNNACDCHDVK